MTRLNDGTLGQLVDHYLRSNFRRSAQKEADAIRRSRPHLDVAILQAVKFSPLDGRKHRHQWRVQNSVLADAQTKLIDASKELRSAKDFVALYGVVNETIGVIRGIGRDTLTVYDIAHRLGIFRGKEPKLVYLHSGTAQGAALLGFKGPAVEKHNLPSLFEALTCAEIEDFLCIYKKQLAGKSLADLTSACFIQEDDME